MYWIYSGNTEQEAQQTAQSNLTLVNNKFIEICGDPWAILQKLTANPEIEGETYYYGFQQPPQQFDYNGATYDLEIEFNQSWFLQE